MTQKEVYNYFEKNYPDIDLYETKKKEVSLEDMMEWIN